MISSTFYFNDTEVINAYFFGATVWIIFASFWEMLNVRNWLFTNGINQSIKIFVSWCVIETLPLQDDSTHVLDSKFIDPAAEQWSPPFFGAGLLQALVLVRMPMLHVVEQPLQFCHSLHPPWTKFGKMTKEYTFQNLIWLKNQIWCWYI